MLPLHDLIILFSHYVIQLPHYLLRELHKSAIIKVSVQRRNKTHKY